MEELLGFAAIVIIISASGVMSPGPLFATTVFYGIKGGAKAGLKMAYGHTVVELPLVLLLGAGALSLETFPEFKAYIAIIGAASLFGFAAIQLKQVFKNDATLTTQTKHGPFLAGIIFSAVNPFFTVWWLTVGFKLISDSLIFWSFWGIAIMFLFHIWMDYVWLSTTAMMSSKIFRILSNKSFKFFILGLSVALIYFGITFLFDAIV